MSLSVDSLNGAGSSVAVARSGGDDIDWAAITAKLPTGKDTASALRRAALFDRFDVNGNGVLSLAEVDKALRDVMGLDSVYSSKPVLMRAFNAARDVNRSNKPKKTRKDDYVERDEFRVLLVYLRQYFELYVAFNRLDTNSDSRLDVVEFRNSLETLAKWGIHLSQDQAEAEFESIDTNGGGAILFDEFCHWAIQKNLDIEDDDDFEDEAGIGFKSSNEASGHLLRHTRAQAASKGKEVAVLGGWRGKMALQTAAANAMHSKIVSASTTREEAARERLNRLRAQAQRELTRAAALMAAEKQKELRRQDVKRVRAESDQLIGRDVATRVRAVPALNDDEIRSVSELFYTQLQEKEDARARTFFQLFKAMDIDGSRRIAFNELERMVRGKLRLGEKSLPQEKLLGLWKVLDENESGFIDTGELSRFLRIGAPKTLTAVERARLKLKQAREERMVRIRTDSNKVLEKDVIETMKDVPRASEEEVQRFGAMFHKQLATLRPRGQDNISYYGLFKHMDVDSSGKVKFDEFERMIRTGLKLSSKSMPRQNIFGIWRTIDENENGFICAGEFGRFMRFATESSNNKAALDQTVNGELQMKKLEDQAHAALKREETWARQTADHAKAQAKAMEAESARLEQLLKAVKSHGIPDMLNTKSSSNLIGSRSSASLARAGGRAEVGEVGATDGDSSPDASPVKRMEVIQMLSREMKQGGGRTRVSATIGSLSVPMLLPSLAKEEGHA